MEKVNLESSLPEATVALVAPRADARLWRSLLVQWRIWLTRCSRTCFPLARVQATPLPCLLQPSKVWRGMRRQPTPSWGGGRRRLQVRMTGSLLLNCEQMIFERWISERNWRRSKFIEWNVRFKIVVIKALKYRWKRSFINLDAEFQILEDDPGWVSGKVCCGCFHHIILSEPVSGTFIT